MPLDDRRRTNDPNFTLNNQNREGNERFWTEGWMTRALMRNLDLTYIETVWEPAAGRGDMVKEILPYGLNVLASDIDMSEFDEGLCEAIEGDFLTDQALFENFGGRADAVIVNPPFKKPLPMQFFLRAASLMDVRLIAMLQRSNWGNAAARRRIMDIGAGYNFAAEIKLTTRPRWDWWLPADEISELKRQGKYNSPRHYFSWFIWDRTYRGRAGEILYASKNPAAGAKSAPLDEDED